MVEAVWISFFLFVTTLALAVTVIWLVVIKKQPDEDEDEEEKEEEDEQQETVFGTEELFSIPYGETIRIFEGEDTISNHVREGEMWEEHICQRMASLVDDETTFLDVGANIGLSSLGVWSILGKPENVKFVMVEMQNEAGRICRYNTRNISKKQIYHCAMSDSAGKIVSYVQAEKNNGGTHMKYDLSEAIVPTLTMDDIALDSKCSVMKVDIEGEEASLFGEDVLFWESELCPDHLFVEMWEGLYIEVSPMIESHGYKEVWNQGHDYQYEKIKL